MNHTAKMSKVLFVTGGAGFIGSAVIRRLINHSKYHVVNIDKLTYAGNLESLKEVSNDSRYCFHQLDINDKDGIKNLYDQYMPCGMLHLAAESHVDRSILGSEVFMQTNILGTYNLLECTRCYLNQLDKNDADKFRFVHISTDEVFGSLSDTEYFTETTAYAPRSPYSASKASSDLLVKAWFHTYKIPVIITNCTNNYGPYHFPEKLIPLVINNALNQMDLPIYGDGSNVRDWLYVDDHANGIIMAFENGRVGESYCIGGHNERSNLQVVETVCMILDEICPRGDSLSYKSQITFVGDRAGHDYRYAMDPSKIMSELGWKPQETFDTGIRKTIKWYLNHQDWVRHIQSGEYKDWIKQNYIKRMGNI